MDQPRISQGFTLPDSVRRAIRTFIQSFLGTLLTGWIGLNVAAGDLPPVSVAKRLLIAATVAGVIALLTYVQNALEDHTGLPALLKAPASSGVNPEPDPTMAYPRPRAHVPPRHGGSA